MTVITTSNTATPEMSFDCHAMGHLHLQGPCQMSAGKGDDSPGPLGPYMFPLAYPGPYAFSGLPTARCLITKEADYENPITQVLL